MNTSVFKINNKRGEEEGGQFKQMEGVMEMVRVCKLFEGLIIIEQCMHLKKHGHSSIIKSPTWLAAIDEQWCNSEERTS